MENRNDEDDAVVNFMQARFDMLFLKISWTKCKMDLAIANEKYF